MLLSAFTILAKSKEEKEAEARKKADATLQRRAVSVSQGVWMYQLTEKGLALEQTGKGTKYFKDDELN
jgi:hypothetical protein